MIQLICMITSSRAFKELFMLNEEKIKIMNKLAMYEQGEGKKYLPVSKYYRSD